MRTRPPPKDENADLKSGVKKGGKKKNTKY